MTEDKIMNTVAPLKAVNMEVIVLFLISPAGVALMSSLPAPLRKEAEIHNPMFIL